MWTSSCCWKPPSAVPWDSREWRTSNCLPSDSSPTINLKADSKRRNPTADTPRGCRWDLSNTSICALDSVIWPKDALFVDPHPLCAMIREPFRHTMLQRSHMHISDILELVNARDRHSHRCTGVQGKLLHLELLSFRGYFCDLQCCLWRWPTRRYMFLIISAIPYRSTCSFSCCTVPACNHPCSNHPCRNPLCWHRRRSVTPNLCLVFSLISAVLCFLLSIGAVKPQ